MRLLVLTINYWPEKTGIGAVVTRRCEHLASAGHEVTVCTGMPYYPEWRIHANYTGKMFLREQRNGITILRSWLWVPKKVSSAKRVLFEASFLASSLLRVVLASKPDVLLVVSPPLGLGLSAVLLKRCLNLPYIFDVEDLQPDAAADLNMLPRSLLPLLYQIEALAYRNATLILTVTEGMRQKIIAKGIPAGKVAVLPAAADPHLFAIDSARAGRTFRDRYGLKSKFIVAHAGNMGVKQGLEVVLDSAFLLREKRDIVFLLAGDGAMRSSLRRRAAELCLTNVRFLPLQEQGGFLQMLGAIDAALVVQQSTVSDIAFPSKVVTLLAAARPVVASVSSNSEVARIIVQSKAGLVIEPERAESLAATIQQLSEDPERRSAMAECGRRYALNHWHEGRILSNLESHILRAMP